MEKDLIPNYAPASFVPESEKGSKLWDKDNKEYIDFGGGIAVNPLGNAHSRLIEALKNKLKRYGI